MSKTATEPLNAVLALPAAERGELVERVRESLDADGPDIESMSEEEFIAELERRHREFERDPSVAIPWEEVKRRSLAEVEADAELSAELERRRAEVRRDPPVMIPWERVQEMR